MAKKYNPDAFYQKAHFFIRYTERQKMNVIQHLLDVQPGDKVLDIGCGTGNILERLDKGELFGVDLSDFMLKIAAEKLQAVNVRLFKGNAENLPREIKGIKFDKIVCSEVVEHIQRPDKLMDEIVAVSMQGTAIVFSFPNEKFISFLKNILNKMRLMAVLLPGVSKSAANEWHHGIFNFRDFKEVIKGKLEVEKITRIPCRFLPLRYVVKVKIKRPL